MTIVNELLKVVVGSQAHGLATPNSDTDYRGVYAWPTDDMFRIGSSPEHEMKDTRWVEGAGDDVSWEVGKFLLMATKSNPSILEVFKSPVTVSNEWGEEMLSLFPYVWSAKGVHDAYIGYGPDQGKKMLDKKDARPNKYPAAFLRVLYNAVEMLHTGTFTMKIADTDIGPTVRKWKDGEFTMGEVIDVTNFWMDRVDDAYKFGEFRNKQTNLTPVNDFLVRLRRAN